MRVCVCVCGVCLPAGVAVAVAGTVLGGGGVRAAHAHAGDEGLARARDPPHVGVEKVRVAEHVADCAAELAPGVGRGGGEPVEQRLEDPEPLQGRVVVGGRPRDLREERGRVVDEIGRGTRARTRTRAYVASRPRPLTGPRVGVPGENGGKQARGVGVGVGVGEADGDLAGARWR